MKSFTKLLFTLLAVLGCTLTTMAANLVSTQTINGLRYYLYDDYTATVTTPASGNFYNGPITIPSSVTYSGNSYSVTTIGEGAFKNCIGVNSVTISSGVTKIEQSAFNGCTELLSISIPNTVSSIGTAVFSNCSSLTSVTIPNRVTTIPTYTFTKCTSLKSVTIPSSVTTIGYSSFEGCSSLENVTIPSYVTTIELYAFKGCSSLTEITIPNSVTSMVGYSFSGCSNLTSVVIGNGVSTIEGYTFAGCTNLEQVTIGGSVTTIEDAAFNVCENLKKVTINSNALASAAYSRSKNLGTMFGEQVTEYVFGGNVTAIGEMAFYSCTDLATVTIPSSVTSVGYQAFLMCSGITTVNINSNANIEEAYLFFIKDGKRYLVHDKNSVAITGISTSYSGNVVIPKTVTAGNTFNVTAIDNTAFYNCTELTSVSIPNSITKIGGNAFHNCTGLTSITIPNSVTSIGSEAFSGCTGLTSVTIPENVTTLGDNAFTGCTNLTTVTINSNAVVSKTYTSSSNLTSSFGSATEYVLGDGVTAIGDYAFYNNIGLTSITIPEGVTSIGNFAFSGCSGLTSITIPENVTSIGNSTFYGCSGLTSITIPSSVTSIGSEAFSGCRGLTSITIPEGVTSIGNEAFYYCTGLTSVTIPETVTTLGDQAFYSCTGLTSITISEGVTTIGEYAFYNCTGLTSVTIPKSVTSIGNNGFRACSNVQEFVFEGETPPTFGTNMFYGSSCPIYVPTADAVTAYKAANNMGSYESRVQMRPIEIDGVKYQIQENGTFAVIANNYSGDVVIRESVDFNGVATAVTSIANNAFYGRSGLTSVTIPSSVTSIGYNAFYGCSGLTSVTIPENVTSIGYSAFRGCSGLTSITLPEGVTSIDNQAFYYCSKLTSITIPSSVTSIGSEAFSSCSGLTSVTISEGVTTIGYSAFYYCSGLTSVTIPETVTSIGNKAFYYCNNAQEFVFEGETPPTFGTDVFYGSSCPIYVPTADAVTAYKAATNMNNYASRVARMPIFVEVDGVKYQLQDDGMFAVVANNYSGDVVIRSSIDYNGVATAVTSIAREAFYGCSDLTSITIPESVTSIGSYVFRDCTSLTSVTIPESVTEMGYGVFYNCSNVQEFVFEGETPPTFGESVFYGSSCPIYVPTASAVTAYKAATNMSSRVSVIPTFVVVDGIKYQLLNDGTFAVVANNYLGEIVIPESVDYNGVATVVTSIAANAFKDCTDLTAVTIPSGVTSIGKDAFTGCSNLTAVTINSNAIASKTYPWTNSLKTIFGTQVTEYVLGDAVTAIGDYAFYGCTGLKSITIPEGVTSIGGSAFSGCTGLTSVTIPESVTSIGSLAFYNCSTVKGFVFEGETPPAFGVRVFDGISCPIYVPNASAETAYKNASNMSNYKNRVQVKPNYTISVVANNDEYGTVSGGGTYGAFAIATISATAVEPYRFVYWDVDGNTEVTHTITVTGDKTYTAIFKRALTVSDVTVADKVYDGNATAQIDYTSEGVLDGDDVTVTALFDDKNVGLEKSVTLVLEGEDAANYAIDAETTDLKANITAKSITISEIATENKEYDGTTTATVTYTATGVVENDEVTIEPTATFADKNVGEDIAVTYSFAKSGEDAGNYTLSAETVDLKANITAKSIAISNITAENKEYDGTTAAAVTYTANGIVENDDMTIEPTATFADKNIGEDIAVTYSFAKSGNDADNYELSVETVDLKANISAKSIAISNIVAEDKEYDGTTTATGLFTYDESAVLDGESVTIAYEASFENKNVGEDKTVTFTFSLSGDDVAHYTLAETTAEVTANISAKTITISELAAENKEYDGTTAATVKYTATGVVENDDVTIEPTATFTDKNVGEDIAITYSFAKSGEDADNYELSVETVDLKANITAKSIAISNIVAENKPYDGTTTATVTYAATGVVENDDVIIDPTAAFADENVGEDKVVTYSFAKSGEDADNYTLSVETVDLKADITAKTIAISNIVAENKEYDGSATATGSFTYDESAVLEGESVTIGYEVAFADKNVGEDKTVTFTFSLSGDDVAHYTLAETTAEVTASITAKAITVSEIAAENKEYDGTTAATVTYTVNGVVENDDVTIEPNATFVDKNVGEDIAVTHSFAKSGDDADNYELSVETVDLKANITAKSITISEIAANDKVYDGTTTATATFTTTGAIENEDVAVNYTATFDNKNAGENKILSLTFELTGEDIANYALASETATATANITAKSITISEITAENKEYDGVTAATVTYTANGVVENDDVTIEPTAEFADEKVGEDKAVAYSFAKSGEDADNYTLSFETVDLKANITAKSITVSEIVANNKEYDGTTAVTATFTTAGAIENEDVAVNYTATFDDKNVGENKTVSLTFELSGEAVANYVLASSTAMATAEITAKSIAISNIAADNKIFDGETTATLAFELDGILENDEVEVSYTANFADENVGEDKAVTFNFAKSGADEANYELAVEAIEPKAAITANTSVEVTITENSGTETYDGTEKTVTGYAVEINSELYKESDFAFNGTAEVKGTNAGEYEMNIVASDFENTNTNFTDVKFTVVDGKLTIEKSSETPNMPELTAETRLLNITDVALPEGWAWADETIVLEEGENSAVANYVGDDAGNYTVESVTITITRLPCLHNGEYTIVDAKEATCTVDGYTGDHKCSICGAIFEQGSVIPAEGHKAGEPVVENYNAPTCKEAGSVDTVYYCTIDGDLISRETYVLEAKGHQPGEKVAENLVPATITSEGSVDSVTYCTVCGEELSREHFVLPVLDHEHIAGEPVVENYVAPTCTEAGAVDTVVYCTVNGEELSREHFVLPALGHTAGEPVIENYTAPTCTEAGTVDTVYYCTIDNEEISRETYVLEAKGHQPSEKVAKNYVAPTCLVAGSVDSVVTCTVCGEILSEEHFVLPALGHTAGEAVVENYTAPTCTEAGTVDTLYYCTIDGELISKETYELPATGHKPSEKVAINYVPATTTTEGSVDSVITCTVCGEVLYNEHFVLPILDHEHIAGEPVEENRVEPTCLVDGSVDTVVYCTVNGEELSREHYILPALGHQPSEKVAKNYVAPTCLVAGSVDSIITCTICGEVLSEEHFVLPATGHIAGEPVIENYIAPTCTEAGTVDTVFYCTVDGDLISRETHVLPMLEHVPGEKVAENYVAPTFTAVGSVDSVVYCTIGGEELSRETFELPMLQKAIEKIEILSMPKTEYVVGEDIDITGAKISVTFNDGSVEVIDLTNEMLSGFDNTLVAEQDITVTYLTFTTTIHVTVNEKTAVSDIATDATSIYAYGHTIVVETASFIGKDIMVYDINGRIIAKVSASDERTEINVPRTGVYGVRIETVSATVMIR